ncbi:MAG TPA: site-2 protease family protein [Terriglobales bacterium]|nr:site-2 protease family protein [Terriglobales bacterium]
MPTHQGSIRLFRAAGVVVFLHWSWFLVAVFEINTRNRRYASPGFNILEYLALFLIVLLHEFGHALACRQVGGTANEIVLWPLGGVAYVNPPPRPGATLWSIAAGPLVNVALFPILSVMVLLGRDWPPSMHDPYVLVSSVWWINLVLLLFNILPIYPLDGGQILRSLLWFVLGRARSLMVATVFGFIGIGGFIILALYIRSAWFGILAVFMLMNCWGGLRHAQALSRIARLPRRDGFACPKCGTVPPVGELWKCSRCGQPFDTFATGAVCPYCSAQFPITACMECGAPSPISEWSAAAQNRVGTGVSPVRSEST